MSVGVFTREKRFKFVNGQETSTPDSGYVACGDGTSHPMEVTGATTSAKLDKIAEIFYRVKDAWFTDGTFSWDWSIYSYSFNYPSTGPPTNRVIEVDTPSYGLQYRGYCSSGADDYNQATYDAGIGNLYSDISDNEFGMWRPIYTSPTYDGVTTAFSYDSVALGPFGSTDWWEGDLSGRVMVKFNGNVAVVKTDPANGFFDETNKFFIGIEVGFEAYSPDPAIAGGSNIYDPTFWDGLGYGPFSDPLVNYVIRLPSGDLTCQLYCDTDVITNVSATDIVHEPIEWWPYALWDGVANAPIWDSSTGVKL